MVAMKDTRTVKNKDRCYVGAHVPATVKHKLKERSRREGRSLSKEIERVLCADVTTYQP
jgi:hypothetical protein